MRTFLLLILMGTACSAAEPRKSEPPKELEKLTECAPESFDEAADCLAEKLGSQELAEIRVDRGFDPKVYEAISRAWRLTDKRSPVSISMAEQGIYDPEFSPAIIISKAQSDRAGKVFNLQGFREVVSQIQAKRAARRANWSPPTPEGMTRVPLSECANLPHKSSSRAVCFKGQDGAKMIVTPDEDAEEGAGGY